jgi:hypothetical protein
MKYMTIKIVASLAFALSVQPVFAQNQPKGHIFNIDGEKCTFTQTTVAESYLHSLKANTGHLIFDDPNCMSADDLGLEVNEMMIANFIVRRYAQPDAAFQTRTGEFKNGSMLQVRGICIQSETYPGVGVVAEFQVSRDHISGVKHAMAVQGCSN